MKATKEALVGAEAELERVTQDLRLPLLADIRRQLSEIKDHVSTHPQQNAAIAAGVAGDEQQQQPTAAAAAAAAAAGGAGPHLLLECADEGLLQKARDVIDQGMMASNSMGSTVGEVIRNELAKSQPGGAAAAAGEEEGNPRRTPTTASVGGLIAYVWRVRFDKLTEDGFLGQGTFGKVLSGRYDGKEVAIKKARAPVHTASTLQDFQ